MSGKLKYVGVKVAGIHNWFWFETTKVMKDAPDDTFLAISGWGSMGNMTNLNVPISQIEGRIYTDGLPNFWKQ
jgi:hypothetical protein